MTSSAQPNRRIASNLLWSSATGLVRHPLAELTAAGRLLAVVSCPEPDRLPATEFYAGLRAACDTETSAKASETRPAVASRRRNFFMTVLVWFLTGVPRGTQNRGQKYKNNPLGPNFLVGKSLKLE